MYKLLIYALLCVISTTVSAQQSTRAAYFVQLTNGNIIYAKTVEHKTPFLKNAYILVDDTDKYKLNDLKAYQDKYGYFHKFKSSSRFEGDLWYKREIEGRINTYSRIVTTQTTQNRPGIGAGPGFTTTTRRKVDYVQTNDTEVKKFAYKTVNELVKDDPLSVEFMQKGKRRDRIRTYSTIAGLGLLIGGSAQSFLKAKDNNEGFKPSPLFWASLPVLAVTWFIPSGNKSYKEAVMVYNRKK